jgi:hypothetical protein
MNALIAARILRQLGNVQPSMQTRLVQYMNDNDVSTTIINSFADCTSINQLILLSFGCDENGMYLWIFILDNVLDVSNDAIIRGQCVRTICELLIESLTIGCGSPNMALFTMAFQFRKPQSTTIENPGILLLFIITITI